LCEGFDRLSPNGFFVNLPILYSFRRCPYAMRARLALLASGMKAGVDYELREIVLRDKPADMLAASPKGTVPVLVLPNGEVMGEVIDQSLDIMLWALRQNDPYHWLNNEQDALAMIAQCDGDFKFHLDRYKYPNRYEGAIATEHRAKASVFAELVNAQLQKSPQHHYKFDSFLGIHNAGYMPFLRQFANTDKAWFAAQPWPALQTALTEFEQSAAFKTVMQSSSLIK
jgi:glutathione S-transferase